MTLSGNNQTTLSPGSYRNITVSGYGILTLRPGVYNINSISLSGYAKLLISPTGAVVLNVAGTGSAKPVSVISGNGVGSPSGAPRNFLINYGGTGQLSLSGTGDNHGVVYAPNAAATVSGSGGWFGSWSFTRLPFPVTEDPLRPEPVPLKRLRRDSCVICSQ